jgi:predicted DCC family thiol-disulfide oxidoreductase YuxK
MPGHREGALKTQSGVSRNEGCDTIDLETRRMFGFWRQSPRGLCSPGFSGRIAATSSRELRGRTMSKWQLRVLIDGACPLCRREADLWRRLDRGQGRIVLEDISSGEFDPARYGLTGGQALRQIHGVLPSGQVIRGMEVFRQAYGAVGWGWLVRPTAWPVLRPLFDRAYSWFARNRLRITRRGSVCGEACSVRKPPPSPAKDHSLITTSAR